MALIWLNSIGPLGLINHHKLNELAREFQKPTQALIKEDFQPREDRNKRGKKEKEEKEIRRKEEEKRLQNFV